jgi:hypothetical protein
MNSERGIGNILTIIFGLMLSVLAVGYFSSYSRVMTEVENPKCGIVITSPRISGRVDKNTHVTGYVNGCGWSIKNGKLGKVALYRYDGVPVTSVTEIIPISTSVKAPYYFDVAFPYKNGNGTIPGHLRFESNGFSKYSLPVIY